MKLYSYTTYLGENGVPYLGKEKTFNVDGRWKYNTPDRIVDFIKDSLGIQRCAEEYVYCICLDNANHIIGLFEIGHGTVNQSPIGVREIMQKALMIGAVNIVLTHNHPSDDVTPSSLDRSVTERIKEAGEIIGIQLLDHIIVSANHYYSFLENELI